MRPNDLFKVNVDDVAPDRREDAKGELANHFEPFSRDFKIPIEIIVTRDFAGTVGRILSSELGVEILYSAKQKEVIAIAKVIPYSRDDGLGFIIVFDASAFGAWEKEQRIWRLLTFIHEGTHVRDDKTLLDNIGAKSFFSKPTTAEDVLFRLAHDIWAEYDAERSPLEIFIVELKKISPNATASFSSHDGHIASFGKLLETLPKFIRRTIDDFCNLRTTMDVFWPEMYNRLRETLVLAAFTSAHSDALNKIDKKLSAIRQNKEYSFFFSIWQSIESDLRALYQTPKQYGKDTLVSIASKLRSFFENCGMILSNTSNGIHAEVRCGN